MLSGWRSFVWICGAVGEDGQKLQPCRGDEMVGNLEEGPMEMERWQPLLWMMERVCGDPPQGNAPVWMDRGEPD